MAKMRNLDQCIGELRSAAQSLNAVADGLVALFSSDTSESQHQHDPHMAPEFKPITLEQVRAVLAEKSRDGHTEKVRELLQKHGATKLSEIDPAKYTALMADAEVIGNG